MSWTVHVEFERQEDAEDFGKFTRDALGKLGFMSYQQHADGLARYLPLNHVVSVTVEEGTDERDH